MCQKGYGEFPDHVCKRAENCSSLEEDISRQKYPKICSFMGNEPVVCCSPVRIKVRPPSSSVKPAVSSYSATESRYERYLMIRTWSFDSLKYHLQ